MYSDLCALIGFPNTSLTESLGCLELLGGEGAGALFEFADRSYSLAGLVVLVVSEGGVYLCGQYGRQEWGT